MSYNHKPNRFSLFINDYKKTDSDPPWKGDGIIDLSELGIGNGQRLVGFSIWVNKKKDGKKYLGGSIWPKEEKEAPVPKEQVIDPDDDLPF